MTIDTLQPGTTVAWAEDEYVILWDHAGTFTVCMLDDGPPVAEFLADAQDHAAAAEAARLWLAGWLAAVAYVG